MSYVTLSLPWVVAVDGTRTEETMRKRRLVSQSLIPTSAFAKHALRNSPRKARRENSWQRSKVRT